MTDFSKETKEILKEEGLMPNHIQFIFEELAKVNWKIRKIKEIGATWKNLNPYLLRAVISEYNKMEINIKTGEIIGRKKEEENDDNHSRSDISI